MRDNPYLTEELYDPEGQDMVGPGLKPVTLNSNFGGAMGSEEGMDSAFLRHPNP